MAEKLLITGITGYIGFKTLKIALQRGYAVRGVVRSDKNIAELKAKEASIATVHENGQLEFAVVPEFLKEGAIQQILDGITVIVHLASPLAVEADDYDEGIIKPAVAMVTTVLEAAAKTSTIRRVVVTSSCVTLIPFEWNINPDSERLYKASDLNNNPKKPYSMSMEAYWASKALARIATSDFITNNKPQFDYVNLLPSVVIGADDRLNNSGKTTDLLTGTRAAVMAPALDSSLNSSFPYVGVPVHVADVALAHIDAIDARIPGNSEFILSSDTPQGVQWDSDIHAIAKKHFATEVDNGELPLQGSLTSIQWLLDGQEAEKAFGWKFTTFEETMKGLIAQYLQLKRREA